MENWIEGVKNEVRIGQVLGALSLGRGHGGSFGPCPACRAERRGHADDRLPCGEGPNGDSWACQACGAKGDVVALVGYGLCGEAPDDLSAEDWSKIRRWLAENRFLTGDAPVTGSRGNVVTPGDLLEGITSGRPRPRKPAPRASGGASTDREDVSPSGQRPTGGNGQRAAGRGPLAWRDDLVAASEAALWGDGELAQTARAYLLDVRRLSERTVRRFRLGLAVAPDGTPAVADQRPWVVIPLLDPAGRPVNARFRSVPIPGTCPECNGSDGCKHCKRYLVCPGRPLPLFGGHTLSNDATLPVLVTEGEFDVMALDTYGFEVNVVSGTAGAGTFHEPWLDLLEPYEQIVGFPDDDAKGKEGWEKVVGKLGSARCSRASLPHKDVGDCLRFGVEREIVERAIGRAEPMHGLAARRIGEFADAIEDLIANPGRLRGVSTSSAGMDEAWGGVRPGVVVVTGETNKGKTTLTTWLLRQLALSGDGVMLTSFEQRPIGTVQKLLRMECGRDFTQVLPEERAAAMARLDALPIRILDHMGNIKPRKILEVISYHARRDGIKRFLLDHLGFLVDPDADDERRATDAIVRALFLLAHQLQVTIFLVAHPHNVPHGQDRVYPKDLKGSSAIRQDMDDILSIVPLKPTKARPWPATRVFFDKVRSEFGIAGSSATLAFDPGACLFADAWEDTPAGRDGLLVPRRVPPHLDIDVTS